MTLRAILPRGPLTPDDLSTRLLEAGWRVSRPGLGMVSAMRGPAVARPWPVRHGYPQRLLVGFSEDEVGVRWECAGLVVDSRQAQIARLESLFPGFSSHVRSDHTTNASLWGMMAEAPSIVLAAFVSALLLLTLLGTVVHEVGGSRRVGVMYHGPILEQLQRTGSVVATVRRGFRGGGPMRVVATGPCEYRVENGRLIIDGELIDEPYAAGGGGATEGSVREGYVLLLPDDRSRQSPRVIAASEIEGVLLFWAIPPSSPSVSLVEVR